MNSYLESAVGTFDALSVGKTKAHLAKRKYLAFRFSKIRFSAGAEQFRNTILRPLVRSKSRALAITLVSFKVNDKSKVVTTRASWQTCLSCLSKCSQETMFEILGAAREDQKTSEI